MAACPGCGGTYQHKAGVPGNKLRTGDVRFFNSNPACKGWVWSQANFKGLPARDYFPLIVDQFGFGIVRD